MPKRFPNDITHARSNLRNAPSSAPSGLERLVRVCLKAQAQDIRLGDLSEQYVRTHERVRAYLGNTALAMIAAHLAADLRYLLVAANVVLLARAVDSGVRLAEPCVKETISLDLRERTMTMMHTASRKLMLPALLLVGSAFLINGAVNVWATWRETEALIVGLQREKADAAAAQIEQYIATVQGHIAWTITERRGAVSPEQRREDYIRLLRQVPAIAAMTQLNAEGKEVLKVSRLARDTIDGGADFSGDVRFKEALKRSRYVGSVYFNDRIEPYVSLAVAHGGPNPGVTVAEVNIKRLAEIVDTVKVGKTGYAYVVDGNGRFIASHDKALVGRTDLATLPQVVAASTAAPSNTAGEGRTFDTSLSGAAVLSVHAAVPTLEWTVFVELPVAEARAPLWSALVRVACLLGLGLLTILLASLAARGAMLAQPART